MVGVVNMKGGRVVRIGRWERGGRREEMSKDEEGGGWRVESGRERE